MLFCFWNCLIVGACLVIWRLVALLFGCIVNDFSINLWVLHFALGLICCVCWRVFCVLFDFIFVDYLCWLLFTCVELRFDGLLGMGLGLVISICLLVNSLLCLLDVFVLLPFWCFWSFLLMLGFDVLRLHIVLVIWLLLTFFCGRSVLLYEWALFCGYVLCWILLMGVLVLSVVRLVFTDFDALSFDLWMICALRDVSLWLVAVLFSLLNA